MTEDVFLVDSNDDFEGYNDPDNEMEFDIDDDEQEDYEEEEEYVEEPEEDLYDDDDYDSSEYGEARRDIWSNMDWDKD